MSDDPSTRSPLASFEVFWASCLLSILLMVVLGKLDHSLRTDAAPFGIISFELAGARAPAILASWSPAQRADALLLQGLDALFLVAYSSFLASAALRLARRVGDRASRLARLGPVVAWLSGLAGLCDAIENVPLIRMLRAGAADPSQAQLALVCATLKFTLVAIGLLYVITLALVNGARVGSRAAAHEP